MNCFHIVMFSSSYPWFCNAANCTQKVMQYESIYIPSIYLVFVFLV